MAKRQQKEKCHLRGLWIYLSVLFLTETKGRNHELLRILATWSYLDINGNQKQGDWLKKLL